MDPTGEDAEEENEMNSVGQLQANGATINTPAGPAMLNGVKVTSANFNKLAQQTPASPPPKKATLTPAASTLTSTPAAATATSTPGLVNVRTSGTSGAAPINSAGTSGAALVNSAVSNQGTVGSGTFSSIQGGQATSAAGQFVQAAPVTAGTTRSAGTAGGSGGSGGSGGGARLAGSVTSVSGGRKLLVRPLHIVVS